MPGSWKDFQPSSFKGRWKFISFNSRRVGISHENLKEKIYINNGSVKRYFSCLASHVMVAMLNYWVYLLIPPTWLPYCLSLSVPLGMVVFCTYLFPTTVSQHMPRDPIIRVRHPIRLDPFPHPLPQSLSRHTGHHLLCTQINL